MDFAKQEQAALKGKAGWSLRGRLQPEPECGEVDFYPWKFSQVVQPPADPLSRPGMRSQHVLFADRDRSAGQAKCEIVAENS